MLETSFLNNAQMLFMCSTVCKMFSLHIVCKFSVLMEVSIRSLVSSFSVCHMGTIQQKADARNDHRPRSFPVKMSRKTEPT